MQKIKAKHLFALSALCFIVPVLLIVTYESLWSPYVPGSYVANDTMQVLLTVSNGSVWLAIPLFVAGLLLWRR